MVLLAVVVCVPCSPHRPPFVSSNQHPIPVTGTLTPISNGPDGSISMFLGYQINQVTYTYTRWFKEEKINMNSTQITSLISPGAKTTAADRLFNRDL